MSEAAAAWLEALDPEQRAKALLDFDDTAERTSWAYFPRPSKGLPLLEMDRATAEARAPAAHRCP